MAYYTISEKNASPSFLQSPEWEKLQNLVGRKTWRMNNALVIKHNLPGGFNYLYCPRPDLSDEFKVNSDGFLDGVRRVALDERSIFLKIDSPHELRILPDYEYKKSDSVQPRKTAILDLRRSEKELLAATHKKTRYNISLAEKKGVVVTHHSSLITHHFEQFWSLLRETAERDGFYTHEWSYYEKLLEVRSENFSNELFFAEYNGKILAVALINFYRGLASIGGGTATYLHGASGREYKEVMAPHLLHWRIMREAKKCGFWYYDLWGIDEEKWSGVTRFKLGFGGEIVEYPQSVDIIYRPILYKFYNFAHRFRK